MAHNDDWFRVAALTDDAKSSFEAMLSKARSSCHQYMDIQAQGLVEVRAHNEAIALIDRIVAENTDYFAMTRIEQMRAECLRSLGDQSAAINAYRRSIEHLRSRPSFRGSAPLDFAYWIAEERIADCFEEALNVTYEFWDTSPLFPVTAFRQHAVLAMLCHELGDASAAGVNARAALLWAERTKSNAANHRSLGLVGDDYADLRRRLVRIVSSKSWLAGILAKILPNRFFRRS